MSRTRTVFTLILVATIAMLIGLAASSVAMRWLTPSQSARPEASEPQQPSTAPTHAVANA
jgi:hypothetical protein